MTQSGLSEFSSTGAADDGADDGAQTEREDLAAQEAAVVAGGGRGDGSDVVDVDEAKFPESTGTVELMITQIDYAVEGYGSDEYPVVHVFGRRPAEHVDGDADHDAVEHLRVLGVEPYFYVPTADLDRDPVEEYDVVIGTREEGPDSRGSSRGPPATWGTSATTSRRPSRRTSSSRTASSSTTGSTAGSASRSAGSTTGRERCRSTRDSWSRPTSTPTSA